jgi:hypothetical protein
MRGRSKIQRKMRHAMSLFHKARVARELHKKMGVMREEKRRLYLRIIQEYDMNNPEMIRKLLDLPIKPKIVEK